MQSEQNYVELPVTDEYRDRLIAFCDSLLSTHQQYVNFKDNQYNQDPISLLSLFKRSKNPKNILREQEWMLNFQPPEGYDSLTLQKQVHPDANPPVLRYALLLNDSDATRYIWVWIQKPNEIMLDVPLCVYLTTGQAGSVNEIETAQPILDELLTIFQSALPIKS